MGARGRRRQHSRSDDDAEPPVRGLPPRDSRRVTDPELWHDHWSEELVEAFHVLVDHCAARGHAILDRASYPAFVEWAHGQSSGYPPRV